MSLPYAVAILAASPKSPNGENRQRSIIQWGADCVSADAMPLAQQQFTDLAVAELEIMYRLARRLSGDPTRADDLVQETYLRAIKAWHTFELRDYGIRPWLTRILHGVHFNRLRRESRQPVNMEESRLDAADREHAQLASDDPHGFETMDQRLVTAIETLKGPYRDALLLWAVNDLNYSEIAHTLNVPIGTVMSRLHRARKQLRARLADSFDSRGMLH